MEKNKVEIFHLEGSDPKKMRYQLLAEFGLFLSECSRKKASWHIKYSELGSARFERDFNMNIIEFVQSSFINVTKKKFKKRKLTTLLLMFVFMLSFSQVSGPDMTDIIDSLETGLQIGDSCGVGNYVNAEYYGDLTLRYDIDISYGSLTVFGEFDAAGYSINLVCTESEFDIEETLSLETSEAPNEVNKITFYPNPTRGEITISIDVKEIYLYDINGRRVKIFKNSNRIDLSDLPPGMYFAQVLGSSNEAGTLKIVKQ